VNALKNLGVIVEPADGSTNYNFTSASPSGLTVRIAMWTLLSPNYFINTEVSVDRTSIPRHLSSTTIVA